jgi:hypothetical protein
MKQIKHFVPEKLYEGKWGYPACRCYQNSILGCLVALSDEAAKTKNQVTCKNCRRTRVFRKLK